MIDLLLCPFCGSSNIDPQGWASTERSGPACDDCGASADTVELWNNRPITMNGSNVVDQIVVLALDPPTPLIRVNGNNPAGSHYEVTHGADVVALCGSLDEADAKVAEIGRRLLADQVTAILEG